MSRNYLQWTVTTRPGDYVEHGIGPTQGGTIGPEVEIQGTGWAVVVTVLDGELISLEAHMNADSRGPISGRRLALLPLREIADVAAAHASIYWRERKGGADEWHAAQAATADGFIGTLDRPDKVGSRPPIAEFAEAWKALKPRGNTTPQGPRPRRAALALHYGVEEVTIDAWIRLARDAGLIPPATTGRLRDSETPPSTKKNQKNTTNQEKNR